MNDHRLDQIPEFDHPPKRVISLWPAITESLFALGFGNSVVGVSDHCIHPADKVGALPHPGSPDAPDAAQMKQLNPELVFISGDETPANVIQKLIDFGLRVWASSPQTVDEALDVLRALLAIYHTDKPAVQINSLQVAVDYARVAAQGQPKKRYFCPMRQIEQSGQTCWMSFNQDTYMSDMLHIAGGMNIFAERKQRTPLEQEIGSTQIEKPVLDSDRYLLVTASDVVYADPEVILLLEDPFISHPPQRQQLVDMLGKTSAVKQGKVFTVPGSLVLWPGVRLGRALQELPEYFR